MKRHILKFTTIFLISACLCWAADPYAVTYERNVAVKMRDGVTLHADIYRPKADGKFSVLLQRTPYDKNNEVDFGLEGAHLRPVVAEDARVLDPAQGIELLAEPRRPGGDEGKAMHRFGIGPA